MSYFSTLANKTVALVSGKSKSKSKARGGLTVLPHYNTDNHTLPEKIKMMMALLRDDGIPCERRAQLAHHVLATALPQITYASSVTGMDRLEPGRNRPNTNARVRRSLPLQ